MLYGNELKIRGIHFSALSLKDRNARWGMTRVRQKKGESAHSKAHTAIFKKLVKIGKCIKNKCLVEVIVIIFEMNMYNIHPCWWW